MLKTFVVEGLSWMIHLFSIQHQKVEQRVCASYSGITLPGEVYSKLLERRVRMTVKPRIKEEQCRFYPGYGKSNLLLTLARILEGAWEYAHPVCMLFCGPEEGACLGSLGNTIL